MKVQFLIACHVVSSMSLSSLAVASNASADLTPSKEGLAWFETKIRPVLVEHCYECHSSGSKSVKAELWLDSREGMLRGGNSGDLIDWKNPDNSLLIQTLMHTHEDIAMPPPKSGVKLTKEQVTHFITWIQMGLPDPRVAVMGNTSDKEAKADWYAWKPVAFTAVPSVKDTAWPNHSLDHFILAGLEVKGLKPVPDADRLTWLRRVTFDLIGLPPTEAEIREFFNDTSAQAYARVVDRLLASPHFGERWGRHWLDVARYAESTGKDINLAYPHAWRYRDYVIDSFNQDKPFQVFLKEQVAGDLMPASSPQQKAEQLIATGFLALGTKSVNEANPKQFALDLADEQIDAVSQAFLGITIACARCHDHKFDPISQQDYYALAGIFLSTDTRFGTFFAAQNRNSSSLIPLPKAAQVPLAATPLSGDVLASKREDLAAFVEETERLAMSTFRSSGNGRGGGGRFGSNRGGRQPRNQQQYLLLKMNQLGLLEARLREYDDLGQPIPLAMGVVDQGVLPTNNGRQNSGEGAARSATPRYANSTPDQAIASRYLERHGRFARPREFQRVGDAPLYVRGDVAKPGEIVPRGFPLSLAPAVSVVVPPNSSGRLQLAEWMLHPQNPLTYRVIVNRIWHWMFGQGIVNTPDNFGTTGNVPSHPELLDFLTHQFIQKGGSIKTLIREIALSRTYGLSFVHDEANFLVDPQNQGLWRVNQRRLDAESLRDALLQVSHQLEFTRPLGSMVAVHGEGPIGLFRQFPGAGVEEAKLMDSGEVLKHRSVYLPVARRALPNTLTVFDFSEPEFVVGARNITNVPEQALFMLNSQFVADAAGKLSDRILAVPTQGLSEVTFKKRLQLGYGWVYGRAATLAEHDAAMEFFKAFPISHPKTELNTEVAGDAFTSKDAWASFFKSLFASAEFLYVN